MSDLDALVIGGGISGLAIAHCLARAGLAVEVCEANARVGGKIHTQAKDGYRLESAASMVMNFRSELDSFLHDTGLESAKCTRTADSQRYVFNAGRLLPAPASLGELMTTPLFSTGAKLRMLAEPLLPRSANPRESVADFVIRRLGREFLDKVFDPYVAGPLASDASLAEARAAMPRLTALENRYRSLVLGALFKKLACRGSAARPQAFSFDGGMARLGETIEEQGSFAVRKRQRAVELWPVRGGWVTRIDGTNGPRRIFSRKLILSTPSYAAARLVSELDSGLARLLLGIEYAPVSVVHTGFDRAGIQHPLDGSGFLLPRDSGYAPNGCLWMSSLFDNHAPPDRVLLTNYLGGAGNRDAAYWDRQRKIDAVMQMLQDLLGVRSEPEMLHIETHAQALPLYHGAYSQRLESIENRLQKFPGLYLEANYRGGVSVRDRILRAQRVASGILQQLSAATPKCSSAADTGLVKDFLPVASASR